MTAETIHLIPSFHYDVIYLKGYREYLEISFRNLLEALAILDEHSEYTFLIEQVILLQEFWESHPECRDALCRFAAEGRVAVSPGMYVMPDMNHPDGESLFRQVREGREWLRKHLGIGPTCCWIADCWGHHAQLPQIMTQAGYDTYFFWRCMRPDVMRENFLWEGLDGTRIRTHWLARGYGNVRFPSDIDVVNAPDLDLRGCGSRQIQRLCEELGEYGNGPVLLCNGGDFLFPQSSAPAAVRALNESGNLPPVRFSTPRRYADAVEWEHAPIVTGEFNSNFQGTFTSNIQIKQRTRIAIGKALDLEALEVVAHRRLPGLAEAWKLLLKQQFHDTICGTVCNDGLVEALAELQHAEARLETACVTETTGADGQSWFNGLGFRRTEIVERGGRPARIEVGPFALVGLGEVHRLGSPEKGTLPIEIETDSFRVSVDGHGYITSLTDAAGVELVSREPCAFGSLGLQMDYGDLWLNFESPLNGGGLESSLTRNLPDPYDRGREGDLANRSTFRARILEAWVTRWAGGLTEVRQRGVVGFWQLQVQFETRIRFRRESRRIEFQTRLVPAGRHYRLRVAFPTSLAEGRIRHEIPYGIEERGEYECAAQNWVDLGTADVGLALLNRGIPGNTIHDGVMMLSLFRSAAMEYKAPSEDSFNEGIAHVFDYAIVPHGPDEDAMIVREGQAFLRPLRRVSGTSDPERTGWRLEVPGAFISALRRTDDGVFVRIHEATGQPARGVLHLPPGIGTFAVADGLERPIGDWKPCNRTLPVALDPFRIQGMLFRGGTGTDPGIICTDAGIRLS